MHNISIKPLDDGGELYIASCPELSVSCYGHTEEEALSKLQSLICFHASAHGDSTLHGGLKELIAKDTADKGVKILHIPDKFRKH